MSQEHESEMNTTEEARVYDLLCRYVFGEATESERAEIEEALRGSEELRAQRVELEATVALVQGAMAAPAGSASAELAPERLAELTAAARAAGEAASSEAGGSSYELKPVAAPKRPWYRNPMLQFAAAATVLVGVGMLVTSEPRTAVEDLSVVASEEARPEGAVFEDAREDLVASSRELGFTPDAATIPGSVDAGNEAMDGLRSMGYLGGDEESSESEAEGMSAGIIRSLDAFGYGGSGGPSVDAESAVAGASAPGPVSASASEPASASASGPGPEFGRAGKAEVWRAMGAVSRESDVRSSTGALVDPQAGVVQKLSVAAEAPKSSSDDFFLGRGEARVPNVKEIELPPAESLSRQQRPQLTRRPGERPRDMFFRFWGDHPFVVTRNDALSTFAADVDTASFSLARRMLREGRMPTRAQIRTEEFVNFLTPDLAAPEPGYGNEFAVHGELAPSPFGGREDRWLLRVGLRARDIERAERPPLALTFVVDTSGSMRTDNRLELVKHALRLLVDQLDGRDSLSIVSFNNEANEVLPPSPATASDVIETALFGLQPGGGTNAEAGLRLGYELSLGNGLAGPTAQRRVVFLSDGVANIGQTDQDRIAEDVAGYASEGVFLNTIGVGMSNHSDVFLEQLANKGQGVCDYVGDAADARRAIVERFISGFLTVAKDVKIQVEFDGAQVLRWRQLGYENRAVADRDFRNDAVDAGEIGAGHQVTCFYEIELASGVSADDAMLGKVRLRYKPIDPIVLGARTTETVEKETALSYRAMVAPSFRGASAGFRLGALNAQFAEFLRGSYHVRGDSLERLATGLANLLSDAPSKDAAAVAEMFRAARELGLKAPPAPRPTDDDAEAQAAYYQSLIESLGGAEESASPAEYESRIRELLDRDREK